MTEAASNAKAALAEADASLRVIQLLEESIKREHKFHRLFTEYTVTPNLQKNFIILQKPSNSGGSGDGEQEDEEYKIMAHRLLKAPKEKFQIPQTSAQEYGWDSTPLVKPLMDRRFYHPRVACEMTRFASDNWKLMSGSGGAKKEKPSSKK